MIQHQTGRVLVIEPSPARAKEIADAVDRLGAIAYVAGDAVAGWREFAKQRPNVVITARRTPHEDGAWFLRRLQTEYMGPMPSMYLLCAADEIDASLQTLEPDGILVPPVPAEVLAQLVGAVPQIGDTAARQAARLRELYELTLLGGDYMQTLDTLVARTALTFGVSDCVLWGPAHEPIWPRTARPLAGPEDEATLLWRCDLALTGGATLLLARNGADAPHGVAAGAGTSYLAAPIELPGGAEIGALCLVDDGAKRFSPDERDALRVLARRLSIEMAWMAAHNRLVDEHEKLRESSLLDPLLGVWTRSALEQSLRSEIAVAQRRGEDLAIAVIDVNQLRQVNDRYGHIAGDAALAHLAQVIRSQLRTQDIIGRFGGDEIAVVMTGTPLAEAREVLTAVHEAVLAHPLVHHGLQIGLGIAIGLTSVVATEDSGDLAFSRALAALRRARRARTPLAQIDPLAAPDSEVDPLADLADGDALPSGSTLGGMYRILHEISRGAMGVVYRGEDLGLARPVAIKVLRSDLARDDDLVAKFRDEAAMLASLHHPNLVQVYSFGAQGDDVYFVMELVEGEPLSELLREGERGQETLAVTLVAKVVPEIAGALDAMHALGLIHRDVKPANILLDRIRERAVLVDVGVAKRRDDAIDAAGTPGFAAPESFMDTPETAATDVYGLAATVYMLLTGLAPFGSGDVEKVVRRQLYDDPAPPTQLRAELSSAVDTVILRALSPDPGERYATASTFAAELVSALAEDADEVTAPDGHASRRTRPIGTTPVRAEGNASPGSVLPWRRDPADDRPSMPLSTRRRAARARAGEAMGHTRGALFRVAYRLLGNQLGTAWVRNLTERDETLAEVLNPQLAPMSWQPVDRLVGLLQRSIDAVPNPGAFAMAIGRATMTATFARFFGADPTSLPIGKVVKAAEAYWSRYHTWGKVTVEDLRAGHCAVVVHNSPGEPLLCAVVEGSLGRVAELAGAEAVTTAHPECVAGNHRACRFILDWREPSRSGTAPGGQHSEPPPLLARG
jgi:diguanylate cyclase (GGDEF)-like protein